MNIFYNHGGKEHLIKMAWRLFVGEPEGLETRHAILLFIILALAIMSLVAYHFIPEFLWAYLFCIVLFFVNIFWFRYERNIRDKGK